MWAQASSFYTLSLGSGATLYWAVPDMPGASVSRFSIASKVILGEAGGVVLAKALATVTVPE